MEPAILVLWMKRREIPAYGAIEGGAGQWTTPLTLKQMERLGIFKEEK